MESSRGYLREADDRGDHDVGCASETSRSIQLTAFRDLETSVDLGTPLEWVADEIQFTQSQFEFPLTRTTFT